MKRSWFWARPGFLWSMSVVLPLAVIPAVLVQEAVATGEWGPGESGAEGGDTGLSVFEIGLVIGWFLVPPLFAAFHLLRYRGGATLWPLFGQGWVSALACLISVPVTALFLLGAAFGGNLRDASTWPMSIWMLAVAAYCQALRAAAVRRSLPDATDSPDALIKVFK